MATESERTDAALDRYARFSDARAATVKRMRYLEYLAWFRGWVSRKDLMERFDIGPTAASSDFSAYTEAYEENLLYDLKRKRYTCASGFKPAFSHNLDRVLQSLAEASRDGGPVEAVHIPVATPPKIQRQMEPQIVSAISRAISTRSEIQATYVSLTSGGAERTLVPLAWVSDGFQWRVRCLDREKGFRDYMLVRFTAIQCREWGSGADISITDDQQWAAIVELEIHPHPLFEYRDAVLSTFNFDDNQTLNVRVRVSELGYLIRQWPIDVTEGARMRGSAYQLHLANSAQVADAVRAVKNDRWVIDALIGEQEEIASGLERQP